MKIYIEILIPILIALLFGFWFVWFKLTKKISQWRYKEQDDKGKIGEEHRQELIRRGLPDPSRAVAKTIAGSAGQGESEGRGNVQATSSLDAGKDSTGTREVVKPRRKFNPFTRRRV